MAEPLSADTGAYEAQLMMSATLCRCCVLM